MHSSGPVLLHLARNADAVKQEVRAVVEHHGESVVSGHYRGLAVRERSRGILPGSWLCDAGTPDWVRVLSMLAEVGELGSFC